MHRVVNVVKMMHRVFYSMWRRSLLYPLNRHQLLRRMELCAIPPQVCVATRAVPFVRIRTVEMMSMVLSKSQSLINVVPGISHHPGDCAG